MKAGQATHHHPLRRTGTLSFQTMRQKASTVDGRGPMAAM